MQALASLQGRDHAAARPAGERPAGERPAGERAAGAPSPTAVPTHAGPAADAAVVQRHVAGVFRFARALGAPRDVAEDLVQDAFAIAWQKRKQALPPAALGAFLRRTAKLLWFDHCRRRRRTEAAIAAAAERLWERDAAHDDGEALAAAARACVQHLQGRAARAVALAYGEGAGRTAIARELGMQPNGVRTLLARTRRWLAACIERHGRSGT